MADHSFTLGFVHTTFTDMKNSDAFIFNEAVWLRMLFALPPPHHPLLPDTKKTKLEEPLEWVSDHSFTVGSDVHATFTVMKK